MRKYLSLAIVLLLVALLVGCASAGESGQFEGGSVTGATLSKDAAGSYTRFNVAVEQAGDPVGIDFRGSVSSGTLRLQLLDAQGQDHLEMAFTPGPFAVNTTIQPPAGSYKLGLAWDGPVQASYNLTWKPHAVEPPTVTPLALVPGLGMLAVALAFLLYAGRRRLGWRYVGLGALLWVVSVAVKFAWAIPINPIVYRAVGAVLPSAVATPVMDVYVGALTGIFEVGFVYLILRRRRWAPAPWQSALAFGIGFGAIEALLLSLTPLLGALAAVLSPASLPASALLGLAQLNNIAWGLMPVVERLSTMFVHIVCGVLIFYAFATGRSRWFWGAFVFKTAVDTIAAHTQLTGLARLTTLWTVEALFALFGLAGWLGTRWVAQQYPAAGTPAQAVD